MNVAVIFAGGTGKRMKTTEKPKQFLLVHGKPIIVHTIDIFENHSDIDGIVIACLEDYIPYMNEMVYRYRLDKVKAVVPGGITGQLSIYNGLKKAAELYPQTETVVLIHDGVRPLIDADLISRNIECVRKNGSCITCAPASETFVILNDDEEVDHIMNRKLSQSAKAPQSFFLHEIVKCHEQALKDGYTDMIDSVTLMCHYGLKPAITECGSDNIKITTPNDFYVFRALYDARENSQIEQGYNNE